MSAYEGFRVGIDLQIFRKIVGIQIPEEGLINQTKHLMELKKELNPELYSIGTDGVIVCTT